MISPRTKLSPAPESPPPNPLALAFYLSQGNEDFSSLTGLENRFSLGEVQGEIGEMPEWPIGPDC